MSSPPPEPDPISGVAAAVAGGTRQRAGNAMGRARSGILDGARRCLTDAGPRGLTMSGAADRGGVARATVYNHFRDRAELVSALAVDTVERLAEVAAAAPDLAGALSAAGSAAAALPELRGAVARDPSVAALVVVPSDSPAWPAAREAVAALLDRHTGAAAEAEVDLVLRWLGAVAVAAPPAAAVEAEAARLAAGLAAAPPA